MLVLLITWFLLAFTVGNVTLLLVKLVLVVNFILLLVKVVFFNILTDGFN